jgi:NitT/TauT family transport system permease protein
MKKVWLFSLTALPLWELIRQGFRVSPILMPSLRNIFLALIRDLGTGLLFRQIGLSFALILSALVLALILGIVGIGFSIRFSWIDQFLDFLTSLLHPLPGIVLLPIIILWFGIGPTAVIAMIVHSVVWPLYTNLKAGYRSLSPVWTMVAHNYHIRGTQYLAQIVLPGSTMYLLTGLRVGWARGWRALLSAEMIFGAAWGSGGLGWYIHNQRVFMDSEGLYSGILVIMILGFLVEQVIFQWIEHHTVKKWGMVQ